MLLTPKQAEILTHFISLWFRRSEVIGLKWDAIDFKNETLEIKHTVVKNKTTVAKDKTKKFSNKRQYKLLPEIKEIL